MLSRREGLESTVRLLCRHCKETMLIIIITGELKVKKSESGIIIKTPVIRTGFIPDGPASKSPLQ